MDRERDKRVAEALGWTHIGEYEPDMKHPEAVAKYWNGLAGTPPEFPNSGVPIPDYSRWENAGPLLEKMLEEGWRLSIGVLPKGHGITLSALYTLTGPRNRTTVRGDGPTLPDAIAEVFLKTRGGT